MFLTPALPLLLPMLLPLLAIAGGLDVSCGCGVFGSPALVGVRPARRRGPHGRQPSLPTALQVQDFVQQVSYFGTGVTRVCVCTFRLTSYPKVGIMKVEEVGGGGYQVLCM